MQTAREQGDRIGMLLDLDQGSMTVWKNGEQLGVIQAEGLSGPLCWAVSLYRGAVIPRRRRAHRVRAGTRVADGGGAGGGKGVAGSPLMIV